MLQAATAQESAESAEQSPRVGLTLGLGVTLSDVADKMVVGVRSVAVFDKTLGALHLYGNVYDKVLYDEQMDMRTTHFEEEIGYRFSISQMAGIAVFVNNINNIYVAPQAPPGMSAIEGIAEPGLTFDSRFSFGTIQASLGIPLVYRQGWQAPDVEPVPGIHPEISWQSNFGMGLYGGFSLAFPPGSNKDLSSNELPFERTEWKVSYMMRSFYVELYLYTTLDFKKVNICPTITYFTGPFSVWFNLDMGKINNVSDFGVRPTAGVTYSL
jgi:hypothetical protein